MQKRPDGMPWSLIEPDDVRKANSSFDSFFRQARIYLKEIEKTRESLQEAQTKFTGIEDIWQWHCDFTLTVLEQLTEPLQAFFNLVVRQCSGFPVVICQYWCRLILKLNYIDEQSHILKKLLAPSCSSGRSFSQHMLSQRKEIYFGIKALLASSDDFHQETVHLLDEAQFLSRQDSASYGLGLETTFDDYIQELADRSIYPQFVSSTTPEEELLDTKLGLLISFSSPVHQSVGLINSE